MIYGFCSHPTLPKFLFGSFTDIIAITSVLTANVTLNGVNINSVAGPAFTATSATINLALAGENVLRGGKNSAGIYSGYNCLLTVDAVSGTGGSLDAFGGDYSSGIGASRSQYYGNLVINGGKVNARGGMGAAGIGGSYQYSGKSIAINGGLVRAQGGTGAPGIGHGAYAVLGLASTVRIAGGVVTALPGSGAHAIGNSTGATVSISGSINGDALVFADSIHENIALTRGVVYQDYLGTFMVTPSPSPRTRSCPRAASSSCRRAKPWRSCMARRSPTREP